MSGSHDHGAVYQDRDAVRAVIVSAAALGVASAIELFAGFSSGSASVVADGLHNAGDVLTTFVLLFAFALARRPASARYTSGYGRIEDVATLVIVVVIVVTAAVAFAESIRRLFIDEPYANIPLSLFAAAVGVVANLAVAGYKRRVGRAVRSTALEADGDHSRIDALVSAAAFVGIGAAGLGVRWADPVAGILITVAIVVVLGGTLRKLYYRMMDAVDPELVAGLTNAAVAVPGVLAVHDVRARWVGRELAVVLHIDCDPDSSLSEAHHVAEEVEHAVSHITDVGQLDVHMDPGTTQHRHGGHHHHGEAPEVPGGATHESH